MEFINVDLKWFSHKKMFLAVYKQHYFYNKQVLYLFIILA